MRSLPVHAALCLCVLLVWAQSAPAAPLDPDAFEVDQQGTLPQQVYTYVVKSVESADSAVVSGSWTSKVSRNGVIRDVQVPLKRPFLLKGVSTKSWVDDKEVALTAVYRVTGTQKVRGYGTVFVLEPAK